jgi:hypothetical protein
MVRDDEARVGGPGVHAEPALLAHAADVVAVEHHERETKPLIELFLPLQHHRWRRGHDDAAYTLTHQQLADDQACLDGLAEAHIVCDEEVHARQQQSFAKRLELVGIDADAGAIGRLKQLRVGRRDRVPAERSVVGREMARQVEVPLREARPVGLAHPLRVHLFLPQHLEFFALRIVFEARESDQSLVSGPWRQVHRLHQIAA